MSFDKAGLRCKKCGNRDASKFAWRGTLNSSRRFRCAVCGTFGSVPLAGSSDYTYTEDGETAEVELKTYERVRSVEDLVRIINLDTATWQIERFVVGKSEAYRKDRQVTWKVSGGVVMEGDVQDSGKLLIEPLYSVKVWLKRKTTEIRNTLVVADLKKDLQNFAPKYKKPNYQKLDGGLLFEIAIFDAHIGKLTWGEESGENSDLKTQTARVYDVLEKLLSYAALYPIEKILLTVGNDWFNSDNKFNTTANGTPQTEDTRWQKTFRAGRVLAVQMIDACAAIAPVDVLIVPGNHDETRTFMLGDSLEAWYHNCPNVRVDNSAHKRKYYQYGKTLIGFTHGSDEKLSRLAGLMANEVPDLWAATAFREWHTGDKHHKEDMWFRTHEEGGVTVRVLRSLSPTDAWHYAKGFVGVLQAAEAFMWSREKGVVAQFTVVAEAGERVNYGSTQG